MTGKVVFAAGPVEKKKRTTGFLWALSAEDGTRLTECRLDALAIHQGIAAAAGRLYVSMIDGRLLCFGRKMNTVDAAGIVHAVGA